MLEMPTIRYIVEEPFGNATRIDRLQAVFFIDSGPLDDSPNTVPFLQKIEKTNPRLEIKLVTVYDSTDIEVRVAPTEGALSVDLDPRPRNQMLDVLARFARRSHSA